MNASLDCRRFIEGASPSSFGGHARIRNRFAQDILS